MNSNTCGSNIAVLGKESSLKKYFIHNFEYRYEKRRKQVQKEKSFNSRNVNIHHSFSRADKPKFNKLNVLNIRDKLTKKEEQDLKKALQNIDCFIYLYQNDSSKYMTYIYKSITKLRSNTNIPIVVFFTNAYDELKFTLFHGHCTQETFKCLKDYAREYSSDYDNFLPVLQNQLETFACIKKVPKDFMDEFTFLDDIY